MDRSCLLYPLLLITFCFRPAQSSSIPDSKAQIYSVLEDYGLKEAFEKGKIYFAVDGGLYDAVHEMFVKDNKLEPMVSICSPHNWGNASKRSMKDNLALYSPEGPNTIEVII